MDAKYREALPTILRNMTLLLSDEDRPQKRKSRKNKKKKLGKNGLYSGEDEFLPKYWKSRQLSKNRVGDQESKEEEIRRHISELRMRETQLQILLILETIHLESPSTTTPMKDDGKDNGSSAKQSKSKKKEEDLNLLLELLIDRLCIWHAVSAVEGVIPESVKETTDSHLSGKKIESDALRDFCTEVIIPFYGSRLPDQCKTIKKKLGGASEPSPSRPPPKLKASSSSSLKAPSGIADGKKAQQLQQRPRRTLQRVLTDERTADSQRARHPSLMRSSTTPALQEVKRESVEPSLPSLGGSVRGGIQVARRVDNREVDLNAVAKQHEAKIKKMSTLMEQKKELDAAISALRKPNRELVSKEIADQAEKRTSSSRKPKNPVRNPLGQGVQVMATPRGSRKKDMSAADHSIPQPRQFLSRPLAGKIQSSTNVDGGTSPELESEISLVPGSTIRPNVMSVASKRKFSNSIAETPSRKRSDALDSGQSTRVSTTMSIPCSRALFKVPTLPSIPRSIDDQPETSTTSTSRDECDMDRTASTINETPPAKGKTQSFFFSRQLSASKSVASSPPAPVIETPIKMGAQAQAVQSTPVKSIYQQLGWDDDDEMAL
jgi:DNA replication regulator SLD3